MTKSEKIINLIYNYDICLDNSEIVSIVFLMCDDPVCALSILTSNLHTRFSPHRILPDLFTLLTKCKCQYFEKKFIESLVLIANYKAVHLLGYNMDEIDKMKEMFRKEQEVSLINTVRKVLLQMCDRMTHEEISILINLINEDFKLQSKASEYHFMEMKLLSLICQDYITDGTTGNCDLSNLIAILRKINKSELANDLGVVSLREREKLSELSLDNVNCNKQVCMARNSSVTLSTDDCYAMKGTIGLCVIVNQRNFSRAVHRKLEYRHGTDQDRDLLKIVFSGLGYNISIIEDVDSIEFEKAIRRIVKHKVLKNHCSFVLCILSHGIEGCIYCIDGVEVPVTQIQNWILGEECPQLLGKPKILIIQSCRGSEKQKVLRHVNGAESLMECDGAGIRHAAPMADLMVYWATVPGYASFRFMESGSVFIQKMCLVMLKHQDLDLHDIFLKVNKHLNETTLHNNILTSQVIHTLTKKIYFPCSQSKKKETAIKLFEKYMIDTMITQCLLNVVGALYYIRKKKEGCHKNSQ